MECLQAVPAPLTSMTKDKIRFYNSLILQLMSYYINNCPTAIDKNMIDETVRDCGVDRERAFSILLGGILDVYDDREFMRSYITPMLSLLDTKDYSSNEYLKSIRITDSHNDSWQLTSMSYLPYEAFVYNESVIMEDGRLIPKIGFFDKEYKFPCVKQNGREWMLITPNEIETMKKPIADAFGSVLTYGLGLGYFPFMASKKKSVESITIVERDATVIDLFKKHILPQFPNKKKITIVNSDAFEFARTMPKYDFVFADIWHDASDGVELYKKFKAYERPDVKYSYWIEDTLKYYMSN